MEKKSILPIGLILTGISFLFISFLLIFFKSNRKLIAQKFKLGGIILTLSGSISSCKPVVSCYEPAPLPDEIYLDYEFYNQDSGYYEYDLSTDTLLHGEIQNRQSGKYSYRLINSNETLVQGDNIQASDGIFDSYYENFGIPITDTISEGIYTIRFYNTDYPSADLDPESAKRDYSIHIKK